MTEPTDVDIDIHQAPESSPPEPPSDVAGATVDEMLHDRITRLEDRVTDHEARFSGLDERIVRAETTVPPHDHPEYVTHGELDAQVEDVADVDVVSVEPPDEPDDEDEEPDEIEPEDHRRVHFTW